MNRAHLREVSDLLTGRRICGPLIVLPGLLTKRDSINGLKAPTEKDV